MRVYRLQFADNPHNGPFNPPVLDPFAEMMGLRASVAPAEAAQVVASLLNKPGPYDMPGPARDGMEASRRAYQRSHPGVFQEDFVFGFESLEQYREWFPAKEEREVLFKQVWLNTDRSQRSNGKPNNLELRCYEVPEDSVIHGGHQVAFLMETATHSVRISRKEATK